MSCSGRSMSGSQGRTDVRPSGFGATLHGHTSVRPYFNMLNIAPKERQVRGQLVSFATQLKLSRAVCSFSWMSKTRMSLVTVSNSWSRALRPVSLI